MSLSGVIKPRSSVFAQDRRATVLNLDNFLDGKIGGEDFFRENFMTVGMSTLIDRCLRQLGGSAAGSSVFLLSQAMGGGKTHSMIALGLLARDPDLRKRVLGDSNPARNLGKVKVIGFNGRNVEPAFGIWGSIAEKLGRRDHFRDYYQPLSAPGPKAWKELLDGQPVIVLLDELPPYMEHARSVQIGNSDLASVTATALANLLIAAAELDSVAVVISDLGGANWQVGGDLIQQSLSNLRNETKRAAIPITPVNPQGDELYQILRCRLFEKLPDDAHVKAVAEDYRRAHAEAVKMGLTATQSQSLYQQIVDSFPFHPAWRDLVGRFKENDGFQQTRGVIRLMQMVVSKLWASKRAEKLELVHPYDIDLNDDELGSEIRTISPHLSEAIAHDVAHSGQSEAELIDERYGNSDATDATRLLLLASLSTVPGATHGLREFELVDFLQRPTRDLSPFKAQVLDQLATRAWYLHSSPDGRLFFKNQQNLAAKLRSTAQALNQETVRKELRAFLEDRFKPELGDVYQRACVLPALDEVELDQDKVTLILAEPVGGHGGLPLGQQWQEWWAQQQFKNRVLFLTGSRLVMQNVHDAARMYRALQSIEAELIAENTSAKDPQWLTVNTMKDRLLMQLGSALTQAFDTIVFPSINEALRAQTITLEFEGNKLDGEQVLKKSLEAAQKFTSDIASESFRLKAEQRLFAAKSTLWSEVRRKAATVTTWPFHPPRALDSLKAECIRKDLWREQGNYVEKGPFPKPSTSIAIRELSRDDNGTSWLRLEPLHGDVVHYEVGNGVPTTSSPKVADCQRFEASQLRYRFVCIDSSGQYPTGDPKEWEGRVELRYELRRNPPKSQLVLRATPKARIKYSVDGSAPENGVVYEAPVAIPATCRVALAVAESSEGVKSDVLQIPISQGGAADRPAVDPRSPCRWRKQQKLDDTAAVWAFIERLGKTNATAHAITITAEIENGDQSVEFSGATEAGYSADLLKSLCEQAQSLVGGPGSLRMRVTRLHFALGQNLLDWVQATDETLLPGDVEQERKNG